MADNNNSNCNSISNSSTRRPSFLLQMMQRRSSLPTPHHMPSSMTHNIPPQSADTNFGPATSSAPVTESNTPFMPARSLSYNPSQSTIPLFNRSQSLSTGHSRTPSESPSFLTRIANKIEEYADSHMKQQFNGPFGSSPARFRRQTFDYTGPKSIDDRRMSTATTEPGTSTD